MKQALSSTGNVKICHLGILRTRVAKLGGGFACLFSALVSNYL
jgi:hypothetical protein